MEHYAFPDIATFIKKHYRHCTWGAEARDWLEPNDLRYHPDAQ